MSNKIKTPSTIETFASVAKQTSLLLMTAAATIGMVELPEHPNNRVAMLAQPVTVFASPTLNEAENNNAIRRERDETAPHYISYNVGQRTPGRMGRQ